ncbi:type II toxin-antitoxin system PemK/MazF family toxin [Paracoccus sp. (in: a-proteobacteria)]|uniref:type II toxin-antitoxin system PemK/MazF family toxin n=1 Tax=Paracoccus sp. TaxID=267 RepID=UPI00396C9704
MKAISACQSAKKFSGGRYVPDAGDTVWLEFIPHAGHEQPGHGPAVVLSPAAYNRIGLMLCYRDDETQRYPFEVPIEDVRQRAVFSGSGQIFGLAGLASKRQGSRFNGRAFSCSSQGKSAHRPID